MQPTDDHVRVRYWIEKCLLVHNIDLLESRDLSGGSGCEVWDCQIVHDGEVQTVVLKVFNPGFVNVSGLGPVQNARKCALLLEELPRLSIPTPRLAGFAIRGESAAVISKKVAGTRWTGNTRVEAARILARLHEVTIEDLSDQLAVLIAKSCPNRGRVFRGVAGGVWPVQRLEDKMPDWRLKHPELARDIQALVDTGEPAPRRQTLVHGDYFSANLLLGPDGLRVIDWEMAALGDPMWDLAFLIGADKNLPQEEVNAVVQEYHKFSPVEPENLTWHKRSWDVYWSLDELVKRLGQGTPRSSIPDTLSGLNGSGD